MADEVDLYEKLIDAQDDILVTPLKWLLMFRRYDPNRAATDKVASPIDSAGKLIDLTAKGFVSPGRIDKKAAVDMAPDRKTTAVEGYGSVAERRTYLNSESFNLDFTTQEFRKQNLEFLTSADMSAVTTSGPQGFVAEKNIDPTLIGYEVFAIGYDNTGNGPIYPWFQYHKMQVEKIGKLGGAMDSPFLIPVTLKALAVGSSLYRFGCGGPGWVPIAEKAGFAAAASGASTPLSGGSTSGSTGS